MSPLPQELQTCEATVWHFWATNVSDPHQSLSLFFSLVGALDHPEGKTGNTVFEMRVCGIFSCIWNIKLPGAVLNGQKAHTFCCVGLLGILTYENPSPQPVGSATPVTSRRHFPFMAAMNARVVFHGAVRTWSYHHIIIIKNRLIPSQIQYSNVVIKPLTSSSIFIWNSSSFSSSGAKKDFSPVTSILWEGTVYISWCGCGRKCVKYEVCMCKPLVSALPPAYCSMHNTVPERPSLWSPLR